MKIMTDLNFMLIFAAFGFIGILVILCFIICMICLGKIHKIKKNTKNALTEESLLKYVDMIRERTGEEMTDSGINPHSFCKYSIVKFNAFEDITGEYSFSFALLDNTNSGIILSSLYGHNSCNTYIRNIEKGCCSVFLLEEEKEALQKAMKGGI